MKCARMLEAVAVRIWEEMRQLSKVHPNDSCASPPKFPQFCDWVKPEIYVLTHKKMLPH